MFRRVLFVPSFATVSKIRSLLVEAGFHPAPLVEAYISGADRGYYVEVLPEEVDRSREFLTAQGYAADLL